MRRYCDGTVYSTRVALEPPERRKVPFVRVDICSPTSTRFVPVVGKLDTGAFMSCLTFDTGVALGIMSPEDGCAGIEKGRTATGQRIEFYVRRLLLRLRDVEGRQFHFPLEVGFAREIRGNLFGFDWARKFCLVFDERRVHLLRD